MLEKIKACPEWRKMAILIVTIFILSMIPIVMISFYAHPYADEYTETRQLHYVISSHGSVVDFISALYNKVVYAWKYWQGNYTGEIFFALNPWIFGEQYYFIGPLIVVFLTIFSVYKLVNSLMKLCGVQSISFSSIISCILLFIFFNFMPDPSSGIFWYEGSFYYIGFQSISFILIALLIDTYHEKISCMRILLIILLIFLVAGGNMQTGIFALLVLALLVIESFVYRCANRKFLSIVMILYLAGFALCVLAPGNSIRGGGEYAGVTPMFAIYKSIHQACVSLNEWNNMHVLILFIGILVPVCLKITENSRLQFRFPILWTFYMLGIFAAMFAPCYYAYDMIGPVRTVNPIYFVFLLLVMSILFYWLGFIKQKSGSFFDISEGLKQWYFRGGLLIITLMFVVGCVATDRITNLTSVNAILSMISGEAQQFDSERKQRSELFEENANSNAELIVEPVSVTPYLLTPPGIEDINVKKERWVNKGIANYYGFTSVVLKGEADE